MNLWRKSTNDFWQELPFVQALTLGENLPSLTIKSGSSKVPNVWLLNERENVLVSRAAGIKQSSQIELWTVHFVKPILVF